MSDTTQMTVRKFCMTKTDPFQLVVIRKGGWIIATAYIDVEDLFRLPSDIAQAPVADHSYGFLDVADPYGQTHSTPCVYIDIA